MTSSIVQGLDKLEKTVQMTSESLKGAKSLSSAVQVCSDEIAEIKEKLSQYLLPSSNLQSFVLDPKEHSMGGSNETYWQASKS